MLGLPKERLYASVFAGEGALPRDDEAVALWKKIGVPADRIVPLGRADNFWGPAGGAGACGPCSEIYFDLGEQRPDVPARWRVLGRAARATRATASWSSGTWCSRSSTRRRTAR